MCVCAYVCVCAHERANELPCTIALESSGTRESRKEGGREGKREGRKKGGSEGGREGGRKEERGRGRGRKEKSKRERERGMDEGERQGGRYTERRGRAGEWGRERTREKGGRTVNAVLVGSKQILTKLLIFRERHVNRDSTFPPPPFFIIVSFQLRRRQCMFGTPPPLSFHGMR